MGLKLSLSDHLDEVPWLRRSARLLLASTLVFLGGAAALPAAADDPPPGMECPGKEYDKETAIVVTYSAPLVKNNIKVSPGETVLFNVRSTDKDRQRCKTGGAWTDIDPGPGPYEIKWTITGEAEFDAAGSGKTTKTTTGLSSGNVTMVVKAAWDGTGNIAVEAKIVDNAPNPVAAPDIGTTKDDDSPINWTFIKRVRCPESTEETAPGTPFNQWRASPASYSYIMNPDVAPAGRPDYEKETILETFGNVTAVGFTMDDLTEAWKTANPMQNTPDKVAVFLWNSSNNGTFVVDANDKIHDRHGGFGDVSPFTDAAKARGFGYIKPQQYKCNGNTIGTYSIEREYKGGTIRIRKTGP
jgi:hypothetical protein